MKIYNITPVNLQNKKYNMPAIQTQSSNEVTPPKYAQLPSTNAYLGLTFTGGYSLDLAKTIERLDILAKKKSNLYPPNIREWAGMILENADKTTGKTKETLIDVHKKFYSSLKECFSLKEAKEKFPEFKDVIPSDEVNFAKGSIFESFKKGELEYFDKDEDFSLQLLKLYWGEGFSLNDLKKYTNGQDLYYTMKKLNIPTVDKDYGHILKFSDPQYNERLTKEMTAKRLEALDRRAQLNDGEPVFIKRGPMSEEHKEHISQGLLRYWHENPDKIYEMSERQKEFFRQNPERAEILSRVATKAWNIFGADRIKAAMSKFMKGKGFKDFNTQELETPLGISKPKSSAIKQFWSANDWAKKSFSKNMEYAWKKVKEENEMSYIIDITPKGFKEKFYKWAKEKGLNIDELEFTKTYYPHKPELNDFRHNISRYTRQFVDAYPGDESSLVANSYFMALLNINREIGKMSNNPKINTATKARIQAMKHVIKESLFVDKNLPFEKNQFKQLDTQEAQAIFGALQRVCMDNHEHALIGLFNKHLDKAYEYLDKNWRPGHPISLNPYGIDI